MGKVAAKNFKILKRNINTDNQTAHHIAFPNTGLLKELNSNYPKVTNTIIHLHWLGDNTLSIEEIGKLKYPIFGHFMINGRFVVLNTTLIPHKQKWYFYK